MISLLLFRLWIFFKDKKFPAMYRLYRIVVFEYGCAFSIISHDKLHSVFDSFNFHISSLKVLAVFLWFNLKLDVCW